MPLIAPNLDDRRFADLVAESKSLIPRYTPEWTDHNESDPGITMLELHAWLHETILYRLNRLPERHYIKFLQMLGIELAPARPAQADLTFKLSRDDLESVIVPKGTRVAAAGGEDGQPVVFETGRALIALGMKLAEIQSFDGFSYSLETKKNNAEGQWFAPFGPHAKEGSALLLGFSSPLKFTQQQIDLTFYIAGDERMLKPRECAAELEAQPVPVVLAWEYYTGSAWQPLRLDRDGTRAFTQSGHVLLRGPGDKLAKAKVGEGTAALYWLRCRLVRGSYEMAPRLGSVMTNTVQAEQAQTIRDEVLGGSDARPQQVFRLANRPVLELTLEVDEGSGFMEWTEVEDFHASAAADNHYVLNRTTGEVRFGHGVNGRIPSANLTNPKNGIVARVYRWGGGRKGNLGAGTLKDLQTFVEGMGSVVNLRAAIGGSDEEMVESAKRRAGEALKNRGRAVTAEDFESIALNTAGVRLRRAKALPLRHPRFPGARIPGAVTVIVVPDGDGPRPMPSESTLRIVCACLNKARLLTTEVWVAPPVYRVLRVEADVIARADADLAEVQRGIEDRLLKFAHPLTGSKDGQGWEFGGTIYYSDIYRLVLEAPGVDRIDNNQLVLWLDNGRADFCRDVAIGEGELVTSETHEIRMAYGNTPAEGAA